MISCRARLMNDHERIGSHRAAFPDAGVPSVHATALLAAAILLAVGVVGVNAAPAQPAGVRTLTIRAAPDESYRAQPNWEATLRTNVAAVSALYEKASRIRFVLLDIVPWSAPRGGRVVQTSKLMADVPPGRADLVVAFSGRCEGYMAGWTALFDRYAVVTSGCGTATTDQATAQVILSHELAHLFGAFHPASNVESVMRTGPAGRFDDQMTRILRLTRDFDFSQGVTSLTPETRRAWSAIYAEGHADGEPNPLAAAFGRAGCSAQSRMDSRKPGVLRATPDAQPGGEKLHWRGYEVATSHPKIDPGAILVRLQASRSLVAR